MGGGEEEGEENMKAAKRREKAEEKRAGIRDARNVAQSTCNNRISTNNINENSSTPLSVVPCLVWAVSNNDGIDVNGKRDVNKLLARIVAYEQRMQHNDSKRIMCLMPYSCDSIYRVFGATFHFRRGLPGCLQTTREAQKMEEGAHATHTLRNALPSACRQHG